MVPGAPRDASWSVIQRDLESTGEILREAAHGLSASTLGARGACSGAWTMPQVANAHPSLQQTPREPEESLLPSGPPIPVD